MISRETFKKIVTLIQEQDELDEKLNDLIETISGSYCTFQGENKKYQALNIVIKELFNDTGEWFDWWLYEGGGTVQYKDGTEKSIDTIDEIYDMLMSNMKDEEDVNK